MKRPRAIPRKLLFLVTVLLVIVFWPRSRTRGEGVVLIFPKVVMGVGSVYGDLGFAVGFLDLGIHRAFTIDGFSGEPNDLLWLRDNLYHFSSLSHSITLSRFSIGVGSWASDVDGDNFAWISVPWWFVFAMFMIYPMIFVRRKLRRRRWERRGLCLHCGYDLRESRERCPECGTAVNRIKTSDAKMA